jgi:hypothetical protein
MAHCSLWFDAPFRIPNQTFRDEVDKVFIVAAKDLRNRLATGPAPAALGIYNNARLSRWIYGQLSWSKA